MMQRRQFIAQGVAAAVAPAMPATPWWLAGTFSNRGPFRQKTPDEILADIQEVLRDTWDNPAWRIDMSIATGMPARYLFPGRDSAMPLTEKGTEIKANMEEEYGPKKGESVFYASKNAGKITGVDAMGEESQAANVPTGGMALTQADPDMAADPGSAPMGDGTVERGDPGPGGHGIGGAVHAIGELATDRAIRDYDATATYGEFKTAGPAGLTLAQIQADADALWKRQYNDGPLGSDDPPPIAWPTG
jgi:hypothetical protein